MVAEAEWVASVLRDFDALWAVMTLENRYRLVHALIEEVVIDGKEGIMTATLVDFNVGLGDGCSGLAEPCESSTPLVEDESLEMAEVTP